MLKKYCAFTWLIFFIRKHSRIAPRAKGSVPSLMSVSERFHSFFDAT